MNIIFDTNILRQDFKMKSAKFEAVFSYLEKTDSRIVLPAVVVREAVNLYKRELLAQLEKTKALADRILRMKFLESTILSINCDLDAEVREYGTFLTAPKSRVDTVLLPINGQHLEETIRRLIENIKPASDGGSHFRDIVIWLSIKEYLANSSGNESVAFISANIKEFADETGLELAPELEKELSNNNLKLFYYKSIEEFLRGHASKIEFITSEWIEANISTSEIERVVYPTLERGETRFQAYAERKEASFAGGMSILSVNPILLDFFVYDMHADGIYLNLTYNAEIELEIDVDDYHFDPYEFDPYERNLFGYNNSTKYLYPQITLYLSARLVNDKVVDIQIDDWDM